MRALLVRGIPAVCLALWLGACARDPFVTSRMNVRSGSWRMERQVDRITGLQIGSALAVGRASNSSIAFPQNATLQLWCFAGKPIATFRFEFKVGNDSSSFLAYRFDEKPGHEIGGQFVASAMSVAIQEPDEIATFVDELSTSKSLYIRIRSISAGRTAAEFKVDGAPAAIEAAYATCPAQKPEPPQHVASRSPRKRAR